MNLIDFMRETAEFMAVDRPDVYTVELAVKELDHAIETLRHCDLPYGCVMFTSYMLSRIQDEEMEEFLLTRKVSSAIIDSEEGDCLVFAYTDAVNLPSVNDPQLGEDEPLDDDDDTW